MMRRSGLLLSLAVLLTGLAYGDVMRLGTLRIIVTDASGAPLPDVEVRASSEDSLSSRAQTTNADGVAQLFGLDPSLRWNVEFRRAGSAGVGKRGYPVRAGETVTLFARLEGEGVTVQESLLDVTSAASGQDLGPRLIEALPTDRSYLGNLRLIPGVLPDSFEAPGNPSSRSGLNYRTILGEIGVSRDNAYFLQGISVTDPITGTFGANLGNEVIQQQSVLTGGVPARFAGGSGLVSNVITRSGGHDFRGSISYFHQDDGLVSSNENRDQADFSIDDVGITVGGPLVQDRAWFFVAYRNLSRDDDVTALDNNEFLRTVGNDTDQFVGKASWQITGNDRLTATLLLDPTETSGTLNRDLLKARDFSTEQGGQRYSIHYDRVLGRGVFEAAVTSHEGEVSDLAAIQEIRNDVLFVAGQFYVRAADAQLGGEGNNDVDERDVDGYRAGAEWLFDTPWGQHTLAGGIEFEERTNLRDRNFVGGAQYQSLSADIPAFCDANPTNCPGYFGGLGALDADFIASTPLIGNLEFDVTNSSDFNGLIATIDAARDRDAFYRLLDSDANGTISMAEAGVGIVFSSTEDNPNAMINYNRDLQLTLAPQETSSEGKTFYVQDTWQRGKWSVNLGLRAEEWTHVATDGREIFAFDTEIAPRLGAAYDIRGDGRSRVSGFYGRYYDPVRGNLTNFAGTLTGRTTSEQVFIAGGGIDRFVTYRTRGGPRTRDTFFSPTTATPYTDELTLGYQRDLGRRMSLEATYINRKTRDVIEDYDLALYAEDTGGGTDYPGDPNHPDSLFLGLKYFGFRDASGNLVNPGSDVVLATLAGGKRDYEGLEVVFRKRFSNRWQALASFSLADAEGNSDSDSSVDFQGDILFLDPRAPNRHGTQPGSIEQLFHAAGSYSWDFGLTVGATVRWNSGTNASRTFQASRRNIPVRVAPGDEFEFAGIDSRWIAPGAVGGITNPSWSSTDLRLRYNHRWDRVTGEFFVDVFNVFDNQAVVRNEDLVAGSPSALFGEAIQWVPPRRLSLGARLSY